MNTFQLDTYEREEGFYHDPGPIQGITHHYMGIFSGIKMTEQHYMTQWIIKNPKCMNVLIFNNN